MLVLVAVLALLTTECTTNSSAAAGPPVPAPAVRAQFIVMPRSDVAEPAGDAFARRLSDATGCRVEHVRAMSGGMQLFAAYAATPELVAACVRNAQLAPGVIWAERDAEVKAQ